MVGMQDVCLTLLFLHHYQLIKTTKSAKRNKYNPTSEDLLTYVMHQSKNIVQQRKIDPSILLPVLISLNAYSGNIYC